MVYLSSHGVTHEIDMGLNSQEFFYMQISAAIIEKSILFNTIVSIHDSITKLVSIPMCSIPMCSIIMISTNQNQNY